MPYAEDAETARRWATERAISCWAWFRGDLDEGTFGALHAAAAASKADGATWVMIMRPDDVPSAAEHLLALARPGHPAAPRAHSALLPACP